MTTTDSLTLTSSSALSSVSAVTEVQSSVFEPLATTISASKGRANGGRGGEGGDEEAGGGDDVVGDAGDDDGCCSAIATTLRVPERFRESGGIDNAAELPASRERDGNKAREWTSLPRLDLGNEEGDAAMTTFRELLEPAAPAPAPAAAAAGEQRACIARCYGDRR